MTLGELIARLEMMPQDETVLFDFAGLTPTELLSYRGYYDELALGFQDDGPAPTVSELLARLRHAVGKTFTGYKGGDYRMDLNTPVWAANWGYSGGSRIVGVRKGEYGVRIMTDGGP